MTDWYSIENLERAWKYAKNEIRDDFVFDFINYEDIKFSKDRVLKNLNNQLKTGQYHPIPLLHISVPKNSHSVRPGTTIAFIDLLVLYAIIQQLAPELDSKLSASAYAYRLDSQRRRTLFSSREAPVDEDDESATNEEVTEIENAAEDDIAFPYNWFKNWLSFHLTSLEAAEAYDYVAVTDITAYFENISLELLFDRIRGLLNDNSRELVNRLSELMRYWDWSSANNKIKGKGLPQGNDISSFLSNIYLIDLDDAMLEIVAGDESKYHRYVDDVKMYTSNYSEAQSALLELEKTLRKLGLNVQSAKTEIVRADQVFDSDVTLWEEQLADSNEEKVENARRFFQEVFDAENPEVLKKWERIYRRSLTVLQQDDNDVAVPIALEMFLKNPSNKLLVKNFLYLKHFITQNFYEEPIFERLNRQDYLFDYHRAFLYRLAAYSRGEHLELKQKALAYATEYENHWFSRVATLLFLHTHKLQGQELSEISHIIDAESNAQVLRATYVTLAQHSGDEFKTVLDSISFFNAPHQDYLRRYFFRFVRNADLAIQTCSRIGNASLSAPEFHTRLHQMDILKANSGCRREFRAMIDQKVRDCRDEWPRLKSRLEGIRDSFIENP